MAAIKQSLARRMLPPPAKKGETYAGIIFKKGRPKYHLFKRSQEEEGKTFDEGKQLAGKDGANCDELRLFMTSIPHKFKTDMPYWSTEEHAGHSNYAWRQWFDNGSQDHWYKGNKSRVCLVRRVPI